MHTSRVHSPGEGPPPWRWGPLRLIELVRALLELLWLLLCIRLKAASVRAAACGADGDWSIADELSARVAQTPDAPALIATATGETLSFRELDVLSNQVARWLLSRGAQPGDVVALVRAGCPRYVALWLGVAKAGGTCALINPQLRGASLLHSVRLALETTDPARHLVLCDGDALDALERAGARRELSALAFAVDSPAALSGREGAGRAGTDGARAARAGDLCLAPLLAAQSGRAVEPAAGDGGRAARGGARVERAPLALIFTSGTTGLPKGVRFSHLRCWMAGKAAHVLCRLGPRDRLYCALPLHHASAGMMGVAAGLVSGCAVLLPPRFSASAFARECAAQGATAVQYIGEMARFVAAASAVSGTAAEREATLRALRVRVALGNGLAPAAWAPFRAALGGGRCRLIEFYGSSEGNVTLFNNTGRPGAVGVVPCFARRLYPLFLARLAVPTAGGAADADVESARAVVVAIGDDDGDDDAGSSAGLEELTLLRDAGTGRCVECAPGEVGQLLGLVDERDPTRRFDGYTDGGASRAKLARGVRRADDVYFCSGDLLRRDWFGFYYWVDRAGDSFRWRGENVASAEVEGVLARAAGISDAAVYGVRVPGCEGRAGMAAVTLALAAKPPAHAAAAALDGATLFAHCAAELAPFARPAFVRVLGAGGLAFTATHKLQKGALRAAGWDAARCGGDALYVRDDRRSAYVPLDAEAVRALEGGALRL